MENFRLSFKMKNQVLTLPLISAAECDQIVTVHIDQEFTFETVFYLYILALEQDFGSDIPNQVKKWTIIISI